MGEGALAKGRTLALANLLCAVFLLILAPNEEFQLTLNVGVKNAFNSFQDDFESGPTRDSDYIYGPTLPRTFFIGIKIGKMH